MKLMHFVHCTNFNRKAGVFRMILMHYVHCIKINRKAGVSMLKGVQ